MLAIIDILNLIISVISWLLLIWFVLSLLVAFNAVRPSNEMVGGLLRGIDRLLSPLLDPIRRILPDTRPMDFSPLVLLVLLRIIVIILSHIALANLAPMQ